MHVFEIDLHGTQRDVALPTFVHYRYSTVMDVSTHINMSKTICHLFSMKE